MLKKDEILEKLNDKYKIIQKKSGYKYGIDTILLSKFFLANLNSNNLRVLDIGTGNGILPVLLYDDLKIKEIVGIDIQEENICRANQAKIINRFDEDKIQFICEDIKKYKLSNYFDIIISNPPYMEINGKKINEDTHKSISRHEINLNLSDFIKNSKRLLKPIGKLCFIHRTHRLSEILKCLDEHKFCVNKIIFIYSNNKKSSMMYIEALKGKKNKLEVESYYMQKEVDFK